jgi:hypothetical protein
MAKTGGDYPAYSSDFTVLSDKRYLELLRTERNYYAVMSFLEDMPTGLYDMFPDWDFEKGEEKKYDEESD